jgi:hypothetical protein
VINASRRKSTVPDGMSRVRAVVTANAFYLKLSEAIQITLEAAHQRPPISQSGAI